MKNKRFCIFSAVFSSLQVVSFQHQFLNNSTLHLRLHHQTCGTEVITVSSTNNNLISHQWLADTAKTCIARPWEREELTTTVPCHNRYSLHRFDHTNRFEKFDLGPDPDLVNVVQPYRTTQLVFPGAKSVYYKDRELNGNPTSASLPLPIPYGRTECHNNGVSDHMSPHGLPEAVENQVLSWFEPECILIQCQTQP